MKILDIPQSGKRGLTVSQGGRYGQISRMLVIPANPQSQSQTAVRAILSANSRAWDALTEAQCNAWRSAAALRPTRPRCGTRGPMTGLQYYHQVNANLTRVALSTGGRAKSKFVLVVVVVYRPDNRELSMVLARPLMVSTRGVHALRVTAAMRGPRALAPA